VLAQTAVPVAILAMDERRVPRDMRLIPVHWRRPVASPFPDTEQMQVLTAIFAPDLEARSSFADWRSALDLQGPFDAEVFRLLPLLYLRLCDLGIEDVLMPRLKGVYRHALMRNMWLLHETEPAVAALEEAGVPTLMLKGAPLALTAYRTPAARPMGDLDVAVPKVLAAEAVRVLEAAGWNSRGIYLGALSVSHAAPFRNARGAEFDLHWHFLQETSRSSVEGRFWQTARSLDLDGIATRMLDPALAILHALVHGLRANPVPPVRWVADCLTLIRHNADLDWNLLVEVARATQVTQRVRLGLDHLVKRFAAPVPIDTRNALGSSSPSLIERAETAALLSPTRGLIGNMVTKQVILLADYFRQGDESGLRRVPGFVQYVHRRLAMTSRLGAVE